VVGSLAAGDCIELLMLGADVICELFGSKVAGLNAFKSGAISGAAVSET
jgi:hypothetical protein